MNIMDNKMINKALKGLLLAMVAVLFAGQSQAQDFKKIDQLIVLEKYAEAESELKTMQANDPKNEKIDYRLGNIYFKQQKYGQARTFYTAGVKHASRSPLNYIGLGAVAVKEKNFSLAKEKLDKALEVDKKKTSATKLGMAEAYIGWEGKIIEGKEYLKEAESLLLMVTTEDANNPAGFVMLGNLYYLKGVDALAKVNYGKAIGIDSKFLQGHHRLGIIYKKEEDYKAAATEFKTALEIDPQYTPSLIEMAEMYFGAGDTEKGLEYMNQYLAIVGTDDPNAIKRKGIFLYVAKKYGEAAEVFESVKGKVDDPAVLRLLAYCYVKMDPADPDKALANFDEYFKTVDSKWYIPMDYQNLGAAKGMKGDMEGMVAEYDKALKMSEEEGEPNLDLLKDLSNQFKESKDYVNQAKYLSQYLDAQTKFNLKETFNLGRAYYFAEDWANADSTFSKMIDKRPELYLGYLWRGRVRDKQDEKSVEGLGLPDYMKVYELIAADEANIAKFKRDFLEACRYMGAYHTLVSKDYKAAIPFWQHILDSNPEDPGASEGLKFCESQG